MALIALFSIAPLSTASAYLITFDSASATDGSVLTTNVAGATVYTFESTLTTPTIAAINADASAPNYLIPSGSLLSEYAAPSIGTADSETDETKYFAVPDDGSEGKATFTFTQSYNYLGLFWGSMDAYNYITFYKGDYAFSEVIDGTMVTNDPPPDGSWTDPDMNRYVNIYTGSDWFDKVELHSTGIAFEFDNLAVAAVPEPATMLLFGTGLAGLAALARRRKTQG